jgi:hypothetical protein
VEAIACSSGARRIQIGGRGAFGIESWQICCLGGRIFGVRVKREVPSRFCLVGQARYGRVPPLSGRVFGGKNVPKSVVDAIKMGFWSFEPELVEQTSYSATAAIPGSREKIEILATRAQEGLPLWHNDDCNDYDDRLG